MATRKTYYRIVKINPKTSKSYVFKENETLKSAQQLIINYVNSVKATKFKTWAEIKKYNLYADEMGVFVSGYMVCIEKI